MGDFKAWAKQRGWWQTQRPSFWQSSSTEEYAGLEKGYWTVLWVSGKSMIVEMLFSPDQQEGCLKAATVLKEKSKSIRRQGIVYSGQGIRCTSREFWFGRSKVERVEESLEKLLNLLHEVGINPSPVCTSCGSRDQLECFKVTHALLSPCLLCPACAEKLKTAIKSGLYRYPKKAELIKGELL